VHPADRLRPWFGVAVGMVSLVGMLAFGVSGRNFGTFEHLKALNSAGSWLTVSLIEASASILALLLAAVALGERIERGIEGPRGLRHHSAGSRVQRAEDHLDLRGAQRLGGLRPHRSADSAVGDDRAFAFMLSSLWATLRLTFVGVPESAPEEENEAQESADVRS
jgi:hypothetical protein